MKIMKFIILCMDKNDDVKSKSISSLLLSLQGNDTLWSIPPIVTGDSITNGDNSLKVDFENFDTSQIAIGKRSVPAYILTVTSNDFNLIEPFRMRLIDHMKDIKFSYVSILVDEVSKEIATRTYPMIYSAENRLREFIVTLLVKKIGEDFLKYVVPGDTLEGSRRHKNNEPYFIASGKVQNDIALLYFDALGKIVYDDTIFSRAKPNSILEKIKTAIDLETLKKELLEGNFQKYFRDSFVKTDFITKWTRLNEIRNKVAHNSYFVECEFNECEKICSDLNTIIDEAFSKMETMKLSVTDMEALKKAVDETIEEDTKASQDEPVVRIESDCDLTTNNISENQPKKQFKTIDEETLINELKNLSESIPFVGFKYFVNDILAKEGYSYDSIYTLINILLERGVLATAKEPNPRGGHDTTSIKIV